MLRTLYVLPLLAFFSSNSFAHEDEPIDSEDPEPSPWSIKLNARYTDSSEEKRYEFPLVLEGALSERIGVELSLPYERVRPQTGGTESGAGDAGLGFKYLITEESGNLPALAVTVDGTFATGSERLGAGEEKAVGIGLLGSKAFGKHDRLFFGIEREREKEKNGGDVSYVTGYSLALSHGVNDANAVAIELIGEHRSDEDERYVTPQWIYNFDSRKALKVGLPIGLTDETFDKGLFVQFVWIFGPEEGDAPSRAH